MALKAGIGTSALTDNAFEAGQQAALDALKNLDQEAALILVFATPQFDLPKLIEGIRSVTGTAQLAGCTSSGEIVQGEYIGFGGGVAVLAVSAGTYRFGIASTGNIKGRLDQVGQDIARESKSLAGPSPYAAAVLLVDCLAGNLQELFRGVYRITGPKIAITGGAAGDELKFQRTFVFHADQVIEGGALALWIASDTPIPVVTRHGWEPIGVPLLVTRAEGTEIIELAGKPAAIAYEEQLGLEPGTLTVQNFWDTSIHHPFGLLQTDGTSVIRVARHRTERDTLMIQGCVPPVGSAVQVMGSSRSALLEVADNVADAARKAFPGAGLLLNFSCAARAVILGPDTPEEARRLQAGAAGMVTFGFYCCGEFARTAGVLGTHNATLTAIAL